MVRSAIGREKGVRYEQWRNKDAEEGGVVRIAGAFLKDHSEEIINLVKHMGKLAHEKRVDEKIESIERQDGEIIVKVNRHNLALRIGKALGNAYKGQHHYKFAKNEQFVEVQWRRD